MLSATFESAERVRSWIRLLVKRVSVDVEPSFLQRLFRRKQVILSGWVPLLNFAGVSLINRSEQNF